jgi:branched-chain amino acid transport system ATP-binding protein
MNDGSSELELVRPSPAAPGSLDISGVTVRFGGLIALDDVSLSTAPRQVTGIIGPNGAGKTTLLNAACGFVRPESGSISFEGHELTGVRPHRLARFGIARTLQGVGLFRGLSVIENVMVGATRSARAGFWSGFLGLPRSDRDERRLREQAMQALSRVGAENLADSMPGTLAYGLRKRVALARALVGHPRLLLLDEPASGLSEKELPELGELIKTFADDASVVVIEHRMDLMMSVCDTIFVLDFGRLIATGTPQEVQANPAVTAAYLGADQNPREEQAAPPDAAPPDAAAPDAAAGVGRAAGERAATVTGSAGEGAAGADRTEGDAAAAAWREDSAGADATRAEGAGHD